MTIETIVEGGKTYTVTDDGWRKAWYYDNMAHRENGPAVEYANGDKFWYQSGELQSGELHTGRKFRLF